jgi:dTMP kinase
VSSDKLKGKLFVVEGLDGSGKSTQIRLLRRWLELEGHPVFFTEWNSSEVVKVVTRKAKKENLLSPTTFSLIHCTDFADRYERQILPLLHAGYIVLCDRYIYTAFARDGVRGCDKTWLRSLYDFAVTPDATFFFDLPTEVALKRILTGRTVLKYHEAGMDLNLAATEKESFKIFQQLIAEKYHELAAEFPFHKIDGALPPRTQQKLVREIVEPIIKKVAR